MIALQLKGKMITAFKPNKPDPERIAWNRTKGWKRGFLSLMMTTPKETSVLTAFQKPTAIWDIKMEDVPQLAVQDLKTTCSKNNITSTAIKYTNQPGNRNFPEVNQPTRKHCSNQILHIACHLPHEQRTSDVCHLKPGFQYQALWEGPAVRSSASLEKCTHKNTGPYIKVNTYTRNKHNSHS